MSSSAANSRRGAVQFWSRTIIPTAKEAPADAEAPSHKLLSRAGYIRRVSAGVYDYLPLAWRVLRKIEQIVREEMDGAGASEMLMPALTPVEFFEQTGRAEAYGPLLFRLTDQHSRTLALGPTHEETITELMKAAVTSYKQLPLNLYQIQTKFRDEARPRAGLLRCREFIMKDAYSFAMSVDGPGGLGEQYDAMYKAYVNTFTRCGLKFAVVEAESGPIGGSASHEFMVQCESGEDTFLVCPQSGYSANVEKCEIGQRPGTFDGEPTGALAEVHTPNMPSIEEVGKFMGVKPIRMLKTIVFRAASPAPGGGGQGEGQSSPGRQAGASWVLAVVRGDHDVNEGKVKSAAGFPVVMAPEKEARAAGFAIGYVSPRVVASKSDVLLLVDPDAAQTGFWATGADKPDHHVKHFNWKRDVGDVLCNEKRVRITDIRNAVAGDPSPRAPGAKLEARRGIEVGHIFKLGTKYSDAMGFAVLDENQTKRSVIMGCYGIGVSRTMAACVESSHDENGIVWPAAIAPYHILITPLKVEPDGPAMKTAGDLAARLAEAGLDVLIDDRDERPGVKFKDADLIGIPIRLTIGDKALAEGSVEFKRRSDTQGKGELVKFEAIVSRCTSAPR